MDKELTSVKNLQDLETLMYDAGVIKISLTISPDKDVSAVAPIEVLSNYFESKKTNYGGTCRIDVNKYFS
jgi:hypothetical protein